MRAWVWLALAHEKLDAYGWTRDALERLLALNLGRGGGGRYLIDALCSMAGVVVGDSEE